MNYAALLAVLVVLGLALPALVRFAERAGVPQGRSIGFALAGAAAVLAWHLIRERVHAARGAREKVERIRAQISADPDSPQAYFTNNEHLGDLLLRLGRDDEALAAFDAYLALERAGGRHPAALERRVSLLRTQVSG